MRYTEKNLKKISEYYEKLPQNYDRNNELKAYYTLLDATNFDYSGTSALIESDSYKCDDYPNMNNNESTLCVNPLLYAINRQDINMCKYLLNKPFNIDLNICDLRSIPAIVYAIRTNNINTICLLLNKECDLKENNIENTNKKSKLQKVSSNTGGRLGNLFSKAAKKAVDKDEDEEDGTDDDDDDDDGDGDGGEGESGEENGDGDENSEEEEDGDEKTLEQLIEVVESIWIQLI